MKYAVSMFPTEDAIRIEELPRAAGSAVSSHCGCRAYPCPHLAPHALSRRRRTPEEYSRTIDPFVGLAAAAAVTTKLKFGTAVCLVVERDPIVLAKEVASLGLLMAGSCSAWASNGTPRRWKTTAPTLEPDAP